MSIPVKIFGRDYSNICYKILPDKESHGESGVWLPENLGLGFDEYIAKPFSKDQIVEQIEKILK